MMCVCVSCVCASCVCASCVCVSCVCASCVCASCVCVSCVCVSCVCVSCDMSNVTTCDMFSVLTLSLTELLDKSDMSSSMFSQNVETREFRILAYIYYLNLWVKIYKLIHIPRRAKLGKIQRGLRRASQDSTKGGLQYFFLLFTR